MIKLIFNRFFCVQHSFTSGISCMQTRYQQKPYSNNMHTSPDRILALSTSRYVRATYHHRVRTNREEGKFAASNLLLQCSIVSAARYFNSLFADYKVQRMRKTVVLARFCLFVLFSPVSVYPSKFKVVIYCM